MREACLIGGLKALGTFDNGEMHQLAGILPTFSAINGQAARATVHSPRWVEARHVIP